MRNNISIERIRADMTREELAEKLGYRAPVEGVYYERPILIFHRV